MSREPQRKHRRISEFFTKIQCTPATPAKTSPELEDVSTGSEREAIMSEPFAAVAPDHEMKIDKILPDVRYIPENFASLPKRKFGVLNLRPQVKWFQHYK